MQAYAAPIARAILRLDFDNIYHSPWYVGIIGLILLSLAVCTFKRVIPARLPPLRPVSVDKIPLHATFEAAGDAADVRRPPGAILRLARLAECASASSAASNGASPTSTTGRAAASSSRTPASSSSRPERRSTGRAAFPARLAVLKGDAAQVPQTHALIRLDDFAYRIAPIMTKSGMVYQPIDYVSRVTVTGNDGVPKQHDGARQSSDRRRRNAVLPIELRLRHAVSRDAKRPARRRALGPHVCSRAIHSTFPERSAPCSTTGSRRRSTSRAGCRPPIRASTIPAVVLGVSQAGSALGEALVPLRTWIDLGDGWRVVPQRYVLYSGFQYRYDPGVPLVGIGAFVLLAGLIISFYLLPARHLPARGRGRAATARGSARPPRPSKDTTFSRASLSSVDGSR